MPAFALLYSGFINGDTPANLSALPVLSTAATAGSPAGLYPILVGGAASTNYTIQYVDGTLTILPAATTGSVTSSANPALPGQPVTFNLALSPVLPGAGIPSGTAHFKIDGSDASGPVPLSSAASSYTNATLSHGLHTVVVEYAGDGNFLGTTNQLASGQVINTPPIAGAVTIQRDPTNGASVLISSLLSDDSDPDGDPIQFVGVSPFSANGGTVVSNGNLVIYTPANGFTNNDTFTYRISDSWGALAAGLVTVNVTSPPPVLTITASDTNKVYGAALPAFTPLYSGFVNGDSPANLSALPVLSTAATAGSPVGLYPLLVGGAASTNYTLQYVNGTLTILPAATTGLVSSSANPALPGQPVAFSLTLNPVFPGAGIPTGTAHFKIDGSDASGPVPLSAAAASYTNAALSHGLHTVVVEYAGDGNFLGTTSQLASAELINTPPIAGAVTIQRDPTNGESVLISSLLSNDSDPDGDPIQFVGVSPLSANGGTVATNGNLVIYTPATGLTNVDTFTYTISDSWGALAAGLVTVNVTSPPPVLTITASDTNKVYGAPLPVFTASYIGFINGDTPANLFALPVLSTPAAAGSSVGLYPILVSGAASTNYTIQYVDGTLTILPAATTGLVSSSANPALPGQPVTFNLTLSPVLPGAGIPSGTAHFKIDGSDASGPVPLGATAASYTNAALSHGLHTVVVEYAGDGNFLGTTNQLASGQVINTPPIRIALYRIADTFGCPTSGRGVGR